MASFDLTGIIDKLISFLPADLQDKAKGARKAIVTGIGALLTVLTFATSGPLSFLVPPNLKKPIAIVISILTALSTYLVPNEPAPATAA